MEVIIVDYQTLFAAGVKSILEDQLDIHVVGIANTVGEAVDKAIREKPDLILMAYDLPDGTGAEASSLILAKLPDCKIIILALQENDEALFSTIRSGAKGFLGKTTHPQQLIASIRSVMQGEAALSASLTLRVMKELARTKREAPAVNKSIEKLSQREADVLHLIASGMSNNEIGSHLYLSKNTVKFHVRSILKKLAIPNRRSAALYARENRMI